MAITLPYPDLVFVPLDKLTAEEMNEIVANYTYIANNAIEFVDNYSTTAVTVNTSESDKVMQSLDISSISTGSKFLAICQVRSSSQAGSPYYYYRLSYSGQTSPSKFIETGDDTLGTIMMSFTKAAGNDSIGLICTAAGSNNTTFSNIYMAALKVN